MPTGYASAVGGTVRQQAAAAGNGPLVVGQPVTVDRQSRAFTAVESDGQATIALQAPGDGYSFDVEVIDIWTDSANTPTAAVYLNSPGPQNEVDYSSSAGHDVAYENPPIYVPAGSQLLIVFSGLSAGANCTARVQYAVRQYVPVRYGS